MALRQVGLVARYFIRYGNADLPEGGAQAKITWAGARCVDKVILVGTPNAGSLKALTRLVDGAVFAPFLPRYAPALIGTMPSVYQLLPRQRHCSVVAVDDRQDCIDPTDSAVWEKMAWGLASPKQDRVLRQERCEDGAVDYGEDHFTCFQFDYDWRRDIVESAQRLHEFIQEKRQYVQNEMDERYGKKNRDIKFDIVAHVIFACAPPSGRSALP